MKCLPIAFLCVLTAGTAYASDRLLYFEAQGVAGYSSKDGMIYRSAMPDDVMQMNGVGVDYIQKFSGETGDIGMAALQARLAYNQDKKEAELQVYNAYLKGKTGVGDVWIGHDRIAFGLESYWDTHADLLQSLPMYGFGFDRDWGVGFSRDFQEGDFKAALTSGSGMGIRTYGNWLFTSRASYGVLGYDNYNVGLSFMGGRILDTMGYDVMDDDPKEIVLGGLDFSYNHDNIEHKAEFDFGKKNGEGALAAFYRIGFNFLEENRLKLEGQYVYTRQESADDYALGAGATYKINADLTARVMYAWQHGTDDHRVVFQFYYYFRM